MKVCRLTPLSATLCLSLALPLLAGAAARAADQYTPVVTLVEPSQGTYVANQSGPNGQPYADVPIQAQITVSGSGYTAGASVTGSITCSYEEHPGPIYLQNPTWLTVGHSQTVSVSGTAGANGVFAPDPVSSTAGTNTLDTNGNIVGRTPIRWNPGLFTVRSSATASLTGASNQTGTSDPKSFTVTNP